MKKQLNANIKGVILSNAALGRGFSRRGREAVERSSAKQLYDILPHLVGVKHKQVPILGLPKC
jgi:hypothetical protein